MNRRFTGLCSVFVLVVCLAAVAGATEFKTEYTFSQPTIHTVTLAGEQYDQIVMSGSPNGGQPGAPALPEKGANLLIPYGEQIVNIEILTGDRISLGTGFYVVPVGTPIRLSADPADVHPTAPDPAVYGLNTAYPSDRSVQIGVNGFRGYQILTLKLQPVEYIPATGEIAYYRSLSVVVTTAPGGKQSDLFRGFSEDIEAVNGKVDNPQMVSTYASAPKAGAKNYDLLIVTTPEYASHFEPLKAYHNAEGINTEIHTTTEIGATDCDAVRAYIRERYLNDGIQFVIIGADDDILPSPNLYVRSWEGSGAEIEYDMPGDVFFACLDGTWNYDGDTRWGETTDGNGGGDVDLIGEVYVGRASVGSVAEADRFVNKTLQYLNAADPYLEKVLMVGEHLGFGGISEYANYIMDELVDGATSNGCTTVGIPTSEFTVDRLYDYNWPSHDWPASEFANRFNQDIHIVNHLGHGSPDYAMKLYNSDVLSQLHNTKHSFVYSQTCLAGHFDGTDCWAETINIKNDYGAWAVIMNSRYGWGDGNSTDGPSQRFNREFWDAIFSLTENKPQIGVANMDSKEDNLYRLDEGCMRWCYYEINLFGDPTVMIKQSGSVAFSYPNGLPGNLVPGEPTTFQVRVTGVREGIPASGTGQLTYRINEGEYQTVNMTEIGADLYEAALPACYCGDKVDFYVSAEEVSAGRFYDGAPNSPHTALSAPALIIAFNDNFEADKSWSVYGDASDGQWERGKPVGDGLRGDPTSDFDGSGACFLTKNAADNSDVDDGTTYLESPIFDLSAGDGMIHYARWFSNDIGSSTPTDVFRVRISNDGGETWTILETVGPVLESKGGWYEHTCWAGDFVTPTDRMKIRFEASDLGGGSIVEAAVDAFSVLVFMCDQDADGVRDGKDNCPMTSNPYQEDANDDGIGDACCCVGMRGNFDCSPDNLVTLSDLTALIDNLFLSMSPLCCPASGDIDDAPGTSLGDLTRLVDYLFISLTPLDTCP